MTGSVDEIDEVCIFYTYNKQSILRRYQIEHGEGGGGEIKKEVKVHKALQPYHFPAF
jgi:hypothetical protein